MIKYLILFLAIIPITSFGDDCDMYDIVQSNQTKKYYLIEKGKTNKEAIVEYSESNSFTFIELLEYELESDCREDKEIEKETFRVVKDKK